MDISFKNEKSIESPQPVIPEMIITAAEDVSDEREESRTECTLVLTPTEPKETRRHESAVEVPPTDQISNGCEEVSTASAHESPPPLSETSAPHSVVQRPLIIEVEQKIRTDAPQSDSKCSDPPTPPPPVIAYPPVIVQTITTAALSTTQRPLVFDGSSSKTESTSIPEAESKPKIELFSISHDDVHRCYAELQTADSDELPDEAVTTEDESAHAKKEGLHGVKKLLDTILRTDTNEPSSEKKSEPVPVAESNSSKDSRSSIRKFFQTSSKSESDKTDAPEIDGQPSCSPKREGLEGIKSFFSSKHEQKSANSEQDVSGERRKGDKSKGIFHGSKPGSKASSEPPEVPEKKGLKKNRRSLLETENSSIELVLFDPNQEPVKKENTSDKIKKFFHSSKPDVENKDKSSSPVTAEQPKSSAPSFKDKKESIKTFFSGKHEQSDSIRPAVETLPSESNEGLESSLEHVKTPSSPLKDAKGSIKTFFSFKHEGSQKKEPPPESLPVDADKLPVLESQSTKASSSPLKDAKDNIKSFFSARHEQTDKQKTSDESNKPVEFSEQTKKGDRTDKAESQSTDRPKTPSSPLKDAKDSIKTFFSPKHDQVDKKKTTEEHPLGESNKKAECLEQTKKDLEMQISEPPKTPSSPLKDAKDSIKTFFSAKHGQTDKKSFEFPEQASKSDKIDDAGTQPTERPKTPSSPLKDAKDSIKTFFSAKHEQTDKKNVEFPEQATKSDRMDDAGAQSTERPKTPSSPLKDSIKTFFSAKHEQTEAKNVEFSEQVTKDDKTDDARTQPAERPKTPSSHLKDAKDSIKTFFSGKHEHTDAKNTELPEQTIKSDKVDDVELQSTERSKTPSSHLKDAKDSIKTFFSGKHEQTDKKTSEELTLGDSGKNVEFPERTKKDDKTDKSKKFFKSSKSDSKLDRSNLPEPESSRSESSAKEMKGNEPPVFSIELWEDLPIKEDKIQDLKDEDKKSSSFAKDAKQNVKAFFGGFKHESSDKKACKKSASHPDFGKDPPALTSPSESAHPKETSSFAKDTKQNIKVFFDNLKHDTAELKQKVTTKKSVPNADIAKGSLIQSPVGVGLKQEPEVEPFKPKSIDVEQPVSEGAVGSYTSTSQTTEQKKASFIKDTKQNIKGFFDNLKTTDSAEVKPKSSLKKTVLSEPDLSKSALDDSSQKPSSHPLKRLFSNRSDKDKSIPEISKESTPKVAKSVKLDLVPSYSNGTGNADDDFHLAELSEREISKSKELVHEISSETTGKISPDQKSSEIKVDVAKQNEKEKKPKAVKRSFSDRVSREEVVQNFKGFFDSLGPRPTKKVASSSKDTEHIYDTVEVRPEADFPSHSLQLESADKSVQTADSKKDKGFKKLLGSFHSKPQPELVTPSEPAADNNIGDKSDKRNIAGKARDKSKEPKSARESGDACDEGSIKKSSSVSSSKQEKTVFNSMSENIMALKERLSKDKRKGNAEVSESSKSAVEIHKSVEIPSITASPEYNKENIETERKSATSANVIEKQPQKMSPIQGVVKDSKSRQVSSASPGSLYDTCCMKIAVLLKDKATHIVTERTKSPPPKPPKPTAEAIAKARAASVAKRIAEAQKNRSVGDTIPVGVDCMRFADDETESSCDYKDVENYDYIMDYELINRYKIDNKLDSSDAPSVCSGMTSYYTADSITLRSFPDAAMETISLNGDFKLAPECNLNETKLQTGVDYQNIQVDGRPVKKIPPPIPPKPKIPYVSKAVADGKVPQSINGLSLSPRLQNKFAKDLAATQKRPLFVAGVAETNFSSLPLPKRTAPRKPLRNFNIVVKNEALRNALDESRVNSSESSLQAKQSRAETKDIEKRTKSPPRPPPPVIAKKPTPRRPPPPPAKPFAPPKPEVNGLTSENLSVEKPDFVQVIEKGEDANLSNGVSVEPYSHHKEEEIVSESEKQQTDYQLETNAIAVPNRGFAGTTLVEESVLKDSMVLNEDDDVNNNTEVGHIDVVECPKPPPRTRRIRSRTVEIRPPEKEGERLKRSQSLSDVDVKTRVDSLSAEKIDPLYSSVKKEKKLSSDKSDSSSQEVSSRPLPAPPPPPRKFRSLERKSKEGRTATPDGEPSDKSCSEFRECIEAKPPARRRKSDKHRFFSLHSEDRKKLSSDTAKRASSVPTRPDRKHKFVPKFDVNANISMTDSPNVSNLSIPETDSEYLSTRSKSGTPNPPPKGETSSREPSRTSWYDENEMECMEMVEWNNEVQGVEFEPPIPVRHKSKKKPRKSSTFYVNVDEPPPTEGSLTDRDAEPVVDKPEEESLVNDAVAQHIFDNEDETALSKHLLVDKETSPLPLDCSEKSVQTSLETLSRGVTSHDDDSEDTDELLDLAQTLQNELKTIINRHNKPSDSTDDTASPPLSATPSDKSIPEVFRRPKSSSVRSSTSEVWPMTSSDESEVEKEGDEVNLTDLAVKRRNKKIFYIAREIMTSEEVFVDALRLLNVDFKSAVETLSKQKNVGVIPEEVLNQILNHLPQLQHLNENLLMELQDRIQNWENHEKIADIIVKMGPFLKLYSWYIHDFESNSALLEDSKRKYPLFAQVIKEFESSSRCKRLALHHYMLKPIQRIPQYRLLLQEYLHQLPEDHKDYQDTLQALQIVTEVANHANDCMKEGDNAQKLISIQNSIMGHKEIVRPGRMFVKEGELMKLSRKGMQPRWFVLFNDMLLYLTPVQPGLYRVNHDLPLAGMKVAIPIQQDYQNEFSIITVTRSFTLAARSPEERQEWIVALTKAIEENASKRSTFTNTRLQQKASGSSEEEGRRSGSFILGQKAPVWIPDARVTMCQLCTSHFTVTFRRHHCRACGKVVCSICSSQRISLPYLGNRIARVCDECYNHLGQGSSVGTESGETDTEGHQVTPKSHARAENRHAKKAKRSLPSVLKEVCANDQGSDMSGHLYKREGRGWKRDWFVLKEKVLYEYRASEDVAALRSTPLLGYNIESFTEPFEGIEAPLLFQLTHPGQSPIVFYTDNPSTLERWMNVLKTATVLE